MNKLVQKWEDELDSLGPFAGFEKLVQHLEKAPAKAPSRNYLAGFVAGHQRLAQSLQSDSLS